MKKLGLLLGVVALLVPSLVLAGDIKIGLMCPLTGKWASEGQDMKNIVSLLVDETNAKGGINGSKMELVVEDDAGDPRTAALAAQKLASAGVVAVIGTYGSAVTEATQNILAESELVQIGTGSTSVRLTEKGLPLFFRTCPRDDAQGKAAAAAMESIARQPDAAGDVRSSLIISMAMMEALTIYGLLIAFMLVAKV